LNEEVTRYLARQLCESLKYIHSKGIAHRDLKPENVLLTSDNPPVLKVADFGLAKAVDSMTKFKTTCGTPCYLAPEVILRSPEEEYSYLVDSWSVGVIVFSMLANASPFVEDETQNIAARFRSRWIDWEMLRQKNESHPSTRRAGKARKVPSVRKMALWTTLSTSRWRTPMKLLGARREGRHRARIGLSHATQWRSENATTLVLCSPSRSSLPHPSRLALRLATVKRTIRDCASARIDPRLMRMPSPPLRTRRN